MDSSSSFEAEYEEVLSAVPDERFDRSRFVPGVGPPDADVMLVGEAPGAQEVEEGEPFVGNAGGRLDSALAEVGVDRGELYLTNLVKVRPPENRDPYRDEIDAWWPVLEAEIDRIDPELIVPLGTFATEEILGEDVRISDVHGQTFERDGRDVLPAYHPAATFYSDDAKEAFAADAAAISERVD